MNNLSGGKHMSFLSSMKPRSPSNPHRSESMATPTEQRQQPDSASITIGQENILESSQNDLPRAEPTVLNVIVSDTVGTLKRLFGDGIAWIVVMVEKKLIIPIREKLIPTRFGDSVHGNGISVELVQEGGSLEDGGSLPSNSQGGLSLTDHQDLEGAQAMESQEPDQGSVGSMLVADLTDFENAVKYLKYPRTYQLGILIYGLNSSFETLKEGFPNPTPAKKALWYLLFGNIGTIFVLFAMLVQAPRGSAKARILVKSMTAAGVVMFGLNLTMIYLKYRP